MATLPDSAAVEEAEAAVLDAAAEEAAASDAGDQLVITNDISTGCLSSSGSSAADGQERTTSDLFHHNISFNWAGPFVLAGLFSFSSLYLSWDAFIVAHRPSSCDHGGAKCR